MKSAKEVLESVSKKKKLKSTRINTFELTHTYDIDKSKRYWVEAPYTLETFEIICAYIQYECALLDEQYSIANDEVIQILEKFYDCKEIKTPVGNYREIDLHENWEIYCSILDKIKGIDIVRRDGIEDILNPILEEWYKDNPEWRPN